MGNVLRLLLKKCCQPSTTEPSESDSHTLGPHGVSAYTVGVTALARDLLQFEVTSQVPEGLTQYVVSSRKAQANWYRKLLQAWKETKPPPRTPEEAARLIIETLQRHQKPDVEGLLSFYGFPLPHTLVELSAAFPYSLPQEVQYKLHTLPVDEKAVPDGDGMTVYVSTADPRESSLVPPEVMMAAVDRSRARAQRDYNQADALHQTIIDHNYRVIVIQNEEVLARKYRIRLRGIDAPEAEMPYGQEAKQELAKLVRGKCLTVLVYDQDQYGRCVGDVYCNGIFAQEVMLKKGLAWHYKAYDQRPEFANWEKQARAKRVGLWASSNPEEPWKWRKDRREGRY